MPSSLKTLLEHFRASDGEGAPETLPSSATPGLTSLLVVNSLRAATMLAASVGVVGAILVASGLAARRSFARKSAVDLLAVSDADRRGIPTIELVSLAGGDLRDEGWASAFGALVKATELCRCGPGALFAAGTWFGIGHTVVFVVASSAVAVPLGFAEVLPGGIVFGGVLLVTLLYFAAVDFLYVGRLAAYVFLLEQPEPKPEPSDCFRRTTTSSVTSPAWASP